MRRLILALTFMCISYLGFTQSDLLKAEGSAPALYLSHTVLAKENYYSIGRMYNISPKEIAPFNKLDFDKALSPGQQIKIPLVAGNFSQDGKAASSEVIVPVYHTVAPKEGLYRISVRYNKIPLATLKKLNNLNSDVVSSGTNLVVGYLKVSQELSPLAKRAKNAASTDIAKNITAKPDDSQTEKTEVKEKPVEEKSPVQKTEPVIAKDDNKSESLAKQTSQSEALAKPASVNFDGGVFKKLFGDDDNKSQPESGVAAVFKSTSGWHDGKYYCLHNSAKPETIIKVTNSSTGKSIYAKVLDMIPDIKQNSGAVILISNAAAEELGASESKFNVSLSYKQQ